MEVIGYCDEETRMVAISEEDFMNDMQISCILSPVSSSDLSDNEDESHMSIKNHADKLEQMMSSQDLDFAKSDIHRLEEELKNHHKKYREIECQLKETEEDLAKTKLERELAYAESKLFEEKATQLEKHVANQIVPTESVPDPSQWNKHVSFHQFTPEFPQSNGWPCSEIIDCDVSNKLFEWWKKQKALHQSILQTLEDQAQESRVSLEENEISDGSDEADCHRCTFFSIFFFRGLRNPLRLFRARKNQICPLTFGKHRKLMKLSVRARFIRPKTNYAPIDDTYDNLAAHTEEEISIHEQSQNSKQSEHQEKMDLLDKIMGSEQEGRKVIKDIQQFLATQNSEINNLQAEMARHLSLEYPSHSSDSSDVESFFSVFSDEEPNCSGWKDPFKPSII